MASGIARVVYSIPLYKDRDLFCFDALSIILEYDYSLYESRLLHIENLSGSHYINEYSLWTIEWTMVKMCDWIRWEFLEVDKRIEDIFLDCICQSINKKIMKLYLLNNIATHTRMAIKKLVSIPNETALAVLTEHCGSIFFASLGIPRLYV